MQNHQQEFTRVEEPEVLPPEGAPRRARPTRRLQRLAEIFGPLAVAVMVDAVDFVSFGQIGLVFGMLVGGSLTYFFTSIYGLPVWQRLAWSLAAGVYCLLPHGRVLPLATLLVAGCQYWRGAARARR